MKTIVNGLRTALAALLLLTGAGALRPASAGVVSSGRVVCSTSTSTPSLISDQNPKWKKTVLLNANTDYILIGDSNKSFSTSASTGTARIATPSSTAPVPFSPVGPTEPYTGQLWCVGAGAGDNVLDFWRVR